MSEFPHDDFAKSFLTELLKIIGNARANRALKAETRTADVWFKFNAKRHQQQRHQLGLLGELLSRDSLIEVFRNPATLVEIRACHSKLSLLEGELLRKARRRDRTLSEAELPELWLIMPTASAAVRESFAVMPTEHPGVYRFPSGHRAGLIVVHQLVQTEATRWLRMLGRNGKQKVAIEEFSHIPTDNDLYASIKELLASYRANLESRAELTQEDEELIMQLSEAYLKKRQEWYEEGLGEGKQLIAINLLQEGCDRDFIAKVTGLTIDMIEQLRQKLDERN